MKINKGLLARCNDRCDNHYLWLKYQWSSIFLAFIPWNVIISHSWIDWTLKFLQSVDICMVSPRLPYKAVSFRKSTEQMKNVSRQTSTYLVERVLSVLSVFNLSEELISVGEVSLKHDSTRMLVYLFCETLFWCMNLETFFNAKLSIQRIS